MLLIAALIIFVIVILYRKPRVSEQSEMTRIVPGLYISNWKSATDTRVL